MGAYTCIIIAGKGSRGQTGCVYKLDIPLELVKSEVILGMENVCHNFFVGLLRVGCRWMSTEC